MPYSASLDRMVSVRLRMFPYQTLKTPLTEPCLDFHAHDQERETGTCTQWAMQVQRHTLSAGMTFGATSAMLCFGLWLKIWRVGTFLIGKCRMRLFFELLRRSFCRGTPQTWLLFALFMVAWFLGPGVGFRML
jgi:hypothetical protein